MTWKDLTDVYFAGYRAGQALERGRLIKACARIDTLLRRVERLEEEKQDAYDRGWELGRAEAYGKPFEVLQDLPEAFYP